MLNHVAKAGLWWILLCLCACASAPTEKGGMTRLQISKAELDAASAPRRLALVVGISAFGDDHWHSLRFAEKDAQDLASVLEDPQRGGFAKVIRLSGPEQTTREHILGELRVLLSDVRSNKDQVVVYVSSHGTLSYDARGELRRYLVTSDAKYSDIAGTALSMDQLKGELESSRSLRRLLILASCHSGTGKSLLPPEVAAALRTMKGSAPAPLEEISRASVVLSASDWGDAAREDALLKNDIYTHFFVRALEGQGDRNGDGAVSALEAHDFARRRTYDFTRGKQRPAAEVLEVGADPIILSGQVAGPGQPELVSYSPRMSGLTVRVDGNDTVKLPGGASVMSGRRRVQLLKGDLLIAEDELRLSPGERVDLERLLHPSSYGGTLFLWAGAFGFLDAASRSELFPGTWLTGLAYQREDWIAPRISVWLSLAGSTGRRDLRLTDERPLPFRFSSVLGSVSATYGWEFQSLRLHTGPTLGGLWAQRIFEVEAYQQSQNLFTFIPGWRVAAVWRATKRLDIALDAGLLFTVLRVDGNNRALGLWNAGLAAGYRFR